MLPELLRRHPDLRVVLCPHEPLPERLANLESRLAADAIATVRLSALLDGDARGIINIGSGKSVAVRDIACLLGERAGRPDLLAFGKRPLAPGEPPRLVADVGRLSRDLGFFPKYRLEAGLAQTLDWWRNEHHV